MDHLIHWSLRNRAVVLILAVTFSIWGAITAVRAPVDVFPDLTAPTVTVLTESPGMASTEVESLVTFPIEVALNGAPGIRRTRSSSAVGISIVYAEFEWGTDIFRARQIVTERLGLVADSLPNQTGEPVLAPISSIMGEILFLGLTTTEDNPIALRSFADTVLRRRLLAVPGVSQVTPIGGGARQYQVWLEPDRLETYGIAITQIADAIRTANQNIPAGFVAHGGSEYLVTGVGRFRNAEDIENLTLESRNGVPIQVRDLGRVQIGARPARGTASVNAEAAVVIGIQKQPDTNTLELTRLLDLALDELETQLPQGMVMHRDLLRQADFIETALANVQKVLSDGAWLVVLIVAFFLLNLQATLITLTAIPLSLVGAVLILEALGGTLNTMTLGGMAIAIGALVDDAVIDVENVVRRLRENSDLPAEQRRTSLRVVLDASVEIRSSIVFATLIIILVFIPLFFLSGIEGRLLQPLGLAYIAALSSSLLVAVTVTPVLCSLFIPKSKAMLKGGEPRHIKRIKSSYKALLVHALRRPLLSLAPAMLCLFIAIVGIFGLGSSFLPEFNEGALTVSAVTLPGTSLEQSDKLGRMVEQIHLAHPEVVSVARRTGRAELDEHANGVEHTELDVRLKMQERSKEEFLADLRKDLEMVPGMLFTIGQPISHRIDHMLSGTRAAVAVKIFGHDLQELRSRAEKVEAAMRDIDGVVDLSIEQQAAVPAIRIDFDRSAMGRLGVNPREAAATLEAAVQGHKATELLEGNYPFDVTLRLNLEGRTLDSLARVPVLGDPSVSHLLPGALVPHNDSAVVPLGAVAKIVRAATPNQIKHENGQRRLVVACNVSGRDLVSTVEDIRQVVEPMFLNQAGYRVEFGGQFESAQSARQRILLLGLAVIGGIAFLLRMAFSSGRDAMFVMANLPLALIGGVGGVWLGDGILSVGSLIGFITVFGIATRNGIMLVSHIRHLQQHEGVSDLYAAVLRGSCERFVPILMTALASGFALIPLAMAGGEPGSEIQTPMAWVILGGLISSTFLNMIVVPALYLRFGKSIPQELA
ncbi:MAG: CusA/CzcA family heavy metal efflux RND transporter [Planctomycetota bacterium]|nr:MAG: CusA/CzcA family heavy metal efflux RND transporter [Planctomycetota bacterium]